MNNTNYLVTGAIARAVELHAGQTRKGDGQSYIVHPVEVGLLVARYTNNPVLIATAFLHDTVEDCNYSSDQLSIFLTPY